MPSYDTLGQSVNVARDSRAEGVLKALDKERDYKCLII
jgi:hypothetical protein